MGLLLVIIANFFWALELILIKKFFPTQNSFIVSAITCVLASIFYAPAFFLYREHFTVKDWVILGILAFTSWFLAQLFYVTGIQKSQSAVLTTLATLTMPLFALVMSVVFLKEQVTPKAIIGGICMVIGFLIISL